MNNVKSKALVVTGVNQVEVRPVEVRRPGAGEVLVEALYTCVSPGTELRCMRGKQSEVKFPYVPGYAMVGRVTERGPGADLKEGTLVFTMGTTHVEGLALAWGGHAAHALRKADELQVLPDGVDLIQASAGKMASTPYHGLRLSRPIPEENVAVIGLGVIGHMAAKLYTATGAHTVAADMSGARVAAAVKAGVKAVQVKGSLKETFAPYFPEGADLIVDCTGAPPVFADALAVARDLPWGNHLMRGPRYVVQGSYEESFSIPYPAAFIRELRILVPRSEQDRDRLAIYQMMKRGAISLASIISDVRPPEAAAATYEDLRRPDTALMTVVFKWA